MLIRLYIFISTNITINYVAFYHFPRTYKQYNPFVSVSRICFSRYIWTTYPYSLYCLLLKYLALILVDRSWGVLWKKASSCYFKVNISIQCWHGFQTISHFNILIVLWSKPWEMDIRMMSRLLFVIILMQILWSQVCVQRCFSLFSLNIFNLIALH